MNNVFTLSASGSAVVIDLTSGSPSILHWGADLGPIESTDDLLKAVTDRFRTRI